MDKRSLVAVAVFLSATCGCVACATVVGFALTVSTAMVSAQVVYQLVAAMWFRRVQDVLHSVTAAFAVTMAVAALVVITEPVAFLAGISSLAMAALRLILVRAGSPSQSAQWVKAVSDVAMLACVLGGLFIESVVSGPGLPPFQAFPLALACFVGWMLLHVLAQSVADARSKEVVG